MDQEIEEESQVGAGGHPLPFITMEDDGTMEVHSSSLEFLENLKGKVIVVAIVGLYRTGKSFFLNLLINSFKEKTENVSNLFSVGATVQACTKGIWLWGEVLRLEDGTNVVFLDTEGLGSTTRGNTNDSRIFALALLLSSYFVYNSRGVIDGNAIEDLSLIINLTQHVQSTIHQGGTNENDLHKFLPSFLWVVRDFTLDLKENGKKISSKQYLENALKPQEGFGEDTQSKNYIRSLLTDFFRHRDCVTLVRPAESEEDLRNLGNINYSDLREDFRTSFESMRKRIFDKAQPKSLYGNLINGAILGHLAQSYVEAINTGKAPVISNAWTRVIASQCSNAVVAALNLFKTELHSRISRFTKGTAMSRNRANSYESSFDQPQNEYTKFDKEGNLRSMNPQSKSSTEAETEKSSMGSSREKTHHHEIPNDLPEIISFPVESEELRQYYSICKKLALDLLDQEGLSKTKEFEKYKENFVASLKDEYQEIMQLNDADSMSFCKEWVEHLYNKTILRDTSKDDPFQAAFHYLHQMEELREAYFKGARGPSKHAALCQWNLKVTLPRVIAWGKEVTDVHSKEIQVLMNQQKELAISVAEAKGQARATQEMLEQERAKQEILLTGSDRQAHAEMDALKSLLSVKTAELEHILQHNSTLEELADTAQGKAKAVASSASVATSPITFSGYLIKESAGLLGPKYKQKFFVLINEHLCYYTTKDQFDRGITHHPPMHLKGATVTRSAKVEEGFVVQVPNIKTLELHARTDELRQTWMRYIQTTIDKCEFR